MKNTIRLLVLTALACSALVVRAQNSPGASGAPPAASPAPADPAAKPAEAPPAMGSTEIVPLIVIDDVPLLDAIKNLARQAGLNFQFDPRVTAMSNQPNVTVRFEKVTSEDALTSVLDNYGMTLQHDVKRRISKITLKDPKAAEPLVSKVIQLKYSDPTNLVALLKTTLSDRSQVIADPRTSQIVVMTTEKEIPGVEELVQKLDSPTKQVLIEAQLWEVAKNPKTIKGIDWSGTTGGYKVKFGNGSATGQASESASTSTTFNSEDGPSSSSSSSSQSSLAGLAGAGGIALNTAKGFFPATAFLNADGLSAVVSFLNTDDDTELVATPRAVTLDNQTANLNVSRAYPVYKITPGSANSPAGSEITWTNVGVILSVTPRIAANSNISMHITPEMSDIAGVDTKVINGEPYSANIYGIRKVETHVMIHSGATLVMGGLINDTAYRKNTKVPVLGDIPGLGLLFRHDEKERKKSNLIVFVTPTIIEDGDVPTRAPSNFLKTELKPGMPDKEWSWWDSGKPKDWTKPKNSEEAASSSSTPPKTTGN